MALAFAASAMLTAAAWSIASAQTVRTEAANHPRIASAIRELEEAIRYMKLLRRTSADTKRRRSGIPVLRSSGCGRPWPTGRAWIADLLPNAFL